MNCNICAYTYCYHRTTAAKMIIFCNLLLSYRKGLQANGPQIKAADSFSFNTEVLVCLYYFTG